MPKYRYRCPGGCLAVEIGGEPIAPKASSGPATSAATDVQRTVPVSKMDTQTCDHCGRKLERIFDPGKMTVIWPIWMQENVPDSAILPSSDEARRRWDEYVE